MIDQELVKMFDCPEIRDGWKPKVGNKVYDTILKEIGVIIGHTYLISFKKNSVYVNKKNLIYIPSIENLLEIIKRDESEHWQKASFETEDLFNIIKGSFAIIDDYNSMFGETDIFVDFKTILFCKYMQAVHNKLWNTDKKQWEKGEK